MPGLGWLPDPPDDRDYTPDTPAVGEVLERLKPKKGCLFAFGPEISETRVDLTPGFPAIQNQGPVGSCTAHAVAGLISYTQKAAHGTETAPSRLFMYSLARRLDGLTGDSGAHLRTAMKSLALIGAPPERYLPYDVNAWDVRPDAFLYALSRPFTAMSYFRLDPDPDLVRRARDTLRSGLPFMFGFLVYPSIDRAAIGGFVPYPDPDEVPIGGHAVVAVGYDDEKRAFRIRNSWGRAWGAFGYGWLPYDYFTYGHAWDCWTLVESDYTDLRQFA